MIENGPSAPAGTLPPSGSQAAIRGTLGIVLICAGILCQQFSSGLIPGFAGFPVNAPVELALNFFMSVDLCGAGIALAVMAAITFLTHSVTIVHGRASALAIIGAALLGIALVAFAFAVPGWVTVISGARGRYDSLTGSMFLAGLPWATGTVLAAIGLRNPHRPSQYIAGAAIAVGLLLAVSAVAASAVYSAGVTD